MMTVAAARKFAGWRYRITRELADGLIDCSTLVSQSLWTGAAVAAPFIAETQRVAYSATAVAQGGWLPGDVLIRYPSREASPDNHHNHVGLYLGPDTSGTEWILESRRPGGVRALPLYAAAALGGVRRFLPNPTRVFEDQGAVLRLAGATPKLGRIGARLGFTRAHPHAHRGVDVYFDGPVEVLAPFAGRAERCADGAVHLHSHARDNVVVLKSLDVEYDAQQVDQGTVLGWCMGGKRSGCNVVESLAHGSACGLHIEYWTDQPLGYSEERTITASGCSPRAGLHAYNPIYAMKLGRIGLPVSVDDTSRALMLPAAAPGTTQS